MARIVWTDPALSNLEAIADYIALDDLQAARKLVQRVVEHVAQLADHPMSGPRLPELENLPYRQIVEPPCRIIYRVDDQVVLIVHVFRGERQLSKDLLRRRDS